MATMLSLWLVFLTCASIGHAKESEEFMNLLVDNLIQNTIKQSEKEINPLKIQDREWTAEQRLVFTIRGVAKVSGMQLYGMNTMKRVGKTMHTFRCS